MNKKWEYIAEILENPNSGMTATELNARGNVGWELVSIRDTKRTHPDKSILTEQSVTEYIFKRKVSN